MSPQHEARTGRRRGNPDTRGDILEAARSEFAENGYDGASVRGIAARAGVDPALIHHYFGSKEKLFAKAIDLPFTPERVVATIIEAPPSERGARMVRTFLSVWEQPAARTPMLAMLRSAMAHESGAVLLRQFALKVMLSRLRHAFPGPNAELRAEGAVTQLLGLAIARYALRIPPVATASVDELVELIGPSLQKYFTP